eukprot:282660_1
MEPLKWNNPNEIIQDDEQICFDEFNEWNIVIDDDDNCDTDHKLNLSGACQYFHDRSPKVSEIFGLFDEMSNKSNHIDDDKMQKSFVSRSFRSDRTDANPYNATYIHVPQLKNTQRFYQFTIHSSFANSIHSLISEYIDHCLVKTVEKGELLALTMNGNKVTVLMMFYCTVRKYQNVDYWIHNFLSHQPIVNAIDESVKPSFTQLTPSKPTDNRKATHNKNSVPSAVDNNTQKQTSNFFSSLS